MAYQSLYRRYRPQRFAEVKGQDHLVRALRNAVAEDRVGHAYLLSGPRGTGKTTTARILAKALNCPDLADGEPCGVCESCVAIEAGRSFDLQELDAASNRGIGEMKALLETIALGTPGRTKVYILDEVHMLTKEASAALLKTLEEPPAHVVFVLATTDPQKVLPTIRSRTQHFELHLLPADELRALVDEVVAAAAIEVTPDQIEYVLKKGGGSARDTLSVLDQVAAAGSAPETADAIDPLVDALVEDDAGAAFAAVQAALIAGREPRALGEQLVDELRDAFLVTMKVELPHRSDAALARSVAIGDRWGARSLTRALEALGEALVEMRQAADPRIPLELALLRITRPESEESLAAVMQRLDRIERALAEGGSLPAASVPPTSAPAPPASDPIPAAPDEPVSAPSAPAGSRGGGSRPADSARQVLASSAGGAASAPPAPASAAPAGARPALGARRGSAARPAPAESPPATPAAPAAGDPPAPPAPVDSGGALTLDQVASAWDVVLPGLPQRIRARWAPGHFVEVTGGVAVFGFTSQIYCDRCEESRAEVEAALGADLGHGLRIELAVSDSVPAPLDAGDHLPAAPVAPEVDHEAELAAIGPVEELEDAGSAADGVARLTDAFPGAELIEAAPDEP
jgi:DNA polymerase-3 subunit gamma/tau